MTIDKIATAQAPKGWSIYTTGRRWQAIRDGLDRAPRDGDIGPMRRLASDAIRDAHMLADADAARGDGDLTQILVDWTPDGERVWMISRSFGSSAKDKKKPPGG
jgi:hypothetical protein